MTQHIDYYPITMYCWDGRLIVCGSATHVAAAGEGWFRTRAEAEQEKIRRETPEPERAPRKTKCQ